MPAQQKRRMQTYFSVLLDSPLFEGFDPDQLQRLLDCVHATQHTYQKNEIIFPAGGTVDAISVILQGHVDTVQEDFWGNQVLLGRFRPGQIFADSFVLAQSDALPFTAISVRRSVILMLAYPRILTVCARTCRCHTPLVKNLLSISARKNIFLLQKVNHVTQRTVREKLLAFLSSRAAKEGSSRFILPYTHQSLADYLAVDRSSVSSELRKLQREGLLSYDKNMFELHS